MQLFIIKLGLLSESHFFLLKTQIKFNFKKKSTLSHKKVSFSWKIRNFTILWLLNLHFFCCKISTCSKLQLFHIKLQLWCKIVNFCLKKAYFTKLRLFWCTVWAFVEFHLFNFCCKITFAKLWLFNVKLLSSPHLSFWC